MADRPILGMLFKWMKTRPRVAVQAIGRIGDALFAKGGDMQLPAEIDPQTGEVQRPVTISVPQGIARDPSNQSAVVTVLFAMSNLFGWDVFGWSPEEANTVYNAGTLIFGALAGILRTRSKNITRG